MSSCLLECLKEAGLERFCASIRRRGYETAFSLLYLPPAELRDVGITTDADRQRFLQLVQIIASFHQGGKLSTNQVVSPQRIRTHQKLSGNKLKGGAERLAGSMTNSVALGYQSSDSSSTSQESSIDYMPSQRRRNKAPSASNHSPVSSKRNLPSSMERSIPTSPTKHRRQQRKRTVNGTSTVDAGTRNTPFVVVSQASTDDILRHDVVNDPASTTASVDRERAAIKASIDDNSTTRSVAMSTESLKVHKVMQTSGYNYGLPRDSPQQRAPSVDSPKMTNVVSSPVSQRSRYDV